MNGKSFNLKKFSITHIFEILVVVMIVVLCLTCNGFAKVSNIMGIFRSMALVGVLAFGIMMVIICGQIDLSAAYTCAMSGIVIGLMNKKMPDSPMGIVLGILLMVVIAWGIGTLNSFLVLTFKFPAFIATMATGYIVYGIAATICGGYPVIGFPSWFGKFGSGMVLKFIPVPALFLIAVFILTYFILNKTKIGREVFAVGGNAEAARLSGINVPRVTRFAFMYVQTMAVISGMLCSAQVMSGSYNFGSGWDFQGISCVIIGGTPFTGGAGTVWGTLVGLFFYGMVNNAMTLFNVSQFLQYVVRGSIILFAVIINSYKRKL